jgi:hypothetical protein
VGLAARQRDHEVWLAFLEHLLVTDELQKLIAGSGRFLSATNALFWAHRFARAGAHEADRHEKQATLMAKERRDREFGKIRDVLADAQREIERLWLAGRRD